MHLTLRQLSVFSAAARHLSFTKAAKELFLTQPAVSMQVRQLEEAVGLPLFEKLGRRVHLTEAGRELQHYSQIIEQQLAEAEGVLEALKGVRRGRLRIAVATTANHFAMRLLADFSHAYSGTSFALDVTNRRSLLEQLAANETDLVIMGKPPEEAGLEAIPFMKNPLVVVAAPDHPLAQRQGVIALAELDEEVFVIREPDSGTRIAMERFFQERGVSLRAGMEMTSNEAIKQAVEAGLGLGVASVHTLELELEAGRLKVLDVEGFPILRHWYLVHCHGKRLSPVAEAFKRFALKQGSDSAYSL